MAILWIRSIAAYLLTTSIHITTQTTKQAELDIPQGHLQGSTLSTLNGRPYFAFKGVPYAQPPTGQNRFKPPLPAVPWKGSLKATEYGSSCPQMDFERDGVYIGSEDCLFLNIYTPDISEDDLKPVMIYIHGGAFNYGSGSGDSYGGARFMDYRVVLVVINYRLGVFGFLNVDEEFAPGNVGLSDQVEALKWVNRNIRFFGGDPDKVTLFGQSAGAASVVYHLLSPLSAGLFHRAIAQSGSAICRWANVGNPLYWAVRLADDMKCPVKSLRKLVECLREIPAEKLVLSTKKYYEFMVWPMPFVPSIQHVESESCFLSRDIDYVLRNGVINNVSVMTGFTRDEGLGLYLPLLHSGVLKKEGFEKNLAKFLSGCLQVKDDVDLVIDAVKKVYLDGKSVDEKAIEMIEIIGDGMNKACGFETARVLASRNIPTYMYSFEHQLNNSIMQRLFKFKENFGVAHGDELVLLFEGSSFGSEPLSSEDDEMSRVMLQMWTHFADHGVPGEIQWPKVSDEQNCVRFCNGTITPLNINGTERFELWKNLDNIKKYLLPQFNSKTEL